MVMRGYSHPGPEKMNDYYEGMGWDGMGWGVFTRVGESG